MIFEAQRLLTRLIVDRDFFARFQADPQRALTQLGVDERCHPELARFDATRVAVFRDVVQGSRVKQFETVFPRLREALAEGELTALVNRFQTEVVVNDSRHWRDVTQFCDWLDAEHPLSLGAAVARYHERALKLQHTARPHPMPGYFEKSIFTETLRITFSIDEVLSPAREALWRPAAQPVLRHYALFTTAGSPEVSVAELDGYGFATLELLRRPRTVEQLIKRLGQEPAETHALLETMLGAGLVVRHG
jgi:hypothetical protein